MASQAVWRKEQTSGVGLDLTAATDFTPTFCFPFCKGTSTQQVIEVMAKLNDRPVIFALSNPTDHAECTAQEAYQYSKGKAIFAAGVQFDPVQMDGKTYEPSQANNFYIFPAVGLAIVATERSALRINFHRGGARHSGSAHERTIGKGNALSAAERYPERLDSDSGEIRGEDIYARPRARSPA